MTTQNMNRSPDGLKSWRALKVFISLVLVSLVLVTQAGCFGARSMSYDIDDYNRAYLNSEKLMLLYNVGLLRDDQPPHFMMLSSIAQTRMFSATASFAWTDVANALHIPFAGPGIPANAGMAEMRGSSSYAVGPFAAGAMENPTFTFVPIQGQDFVNRLETPLRDKFTYLLEEARWSKTRAVHDLVMLFADSLYLGHGEDAANCKAGLYINERPADSRNPNSKTYQDLAACIDDITKRPLQYTEFDTPIHHVPTAWSGDPAAADAVSALKEGYEWTKNGDEFVLSNPLRIPAWLDYEPNFTPPPTPTPPTAGQPTPAPTPTPTATPDPDHLAKLDPVSWPSPAGRPPRGLPDGRA